MINNGKILCGMRETKEREMKTNKLINQEGKE